MTGSLRSAPEAQASEKKLQEARSWCERRQLNKGYVLRKPDPTLARAEKRTTSGSTSLSPGVYLKMVEGIQFARAIMVKIPFLVIAPYVQSRARVLARDEAISVHAQTQQRDVTTQPPSPTEY